MGKNDFDIAIIGGGPAGSTVAIHLARAGMRVGLFEKKTFPRDVLCGEFLSKEVIESLNKLGLCQKFLSLDPNKIYSFRFIDEDSSELETQLPFEAYSMKRSVFDNFLLEEAKKAGAKIFQPIEVKEIEKQRGSFRVKVLGSKKYIEEISSNFVIAAYGKQNILDKKLNRSFINVKSHLNGIKFHLDKRYLQSFSEGEIQIYTSEGIYCGLNTVSKNEVTLCFLEDRESYSDTARNHLIWLMKKNKKFSELFTEDFVHLITSDLQAYGTGNVFFGKRELVKDGIFMIGDAAGVIAPLAGDGIGMAMESADLISNILVESFKNNIDREVLERQYITQWNDHFNVRLFSAGIVQKTVLTNYLRKPGVRIVKLFPFILSRLVQLTRS